MAKLSIIQKLGVAGRIAGQQMARSRTAAAALHGLRATAHSFGRVLRQLWLEVTGFTFLALSAFGVIAGFREYAKHQAGQSPGLGRVILAACFAASFAWFGLSSFFRINRRVPKQRN